MEMTVAVPVDDASRIGEARRGAAALARDAGFSEEDAARVSIVASELATNLHRHATRDRWLVARRILHEGAAGVEVLSLDRGPGIENVVLATRDGFSTSGGSGQGLGAVERLTDEFELQTSPAGTAIVARVHPGHAAAGASPVGAVAVPKPGELRCGDAWSLHRDAAGTTLLVADGLGHGPDAADASAAAVEVFERSSARGAGELVARIHEQVRATRGAAIAVARLENGRLTYAGLGNISGVIATEAGTQNLVSMHGTAGKHGGRITEFAYDWLPGALLVMHSDGITTRWDLRQHPGLLRRHPSLVAGVLFRDHARGRDDACVLAYRHRDPS